MAVVGAGSSEEIPRVSNLSPEDFHRDYFSQASLYCLLIVTILPIISCTVLVSIVLFLYSIVQPF